MIENVMYVEELLHNLQYELLDIGPLDPSDFVSRLQFYQLAGWEDKIIVMLRQAVHQYQAERAILKYLYIADKLVKVPAYQNAASPALVDLYCDVFYFLFAQKCNKQLEELKILRKFWVGSIHPYYLAQMKESLIAKTGIDIDSFSKPQTISKIKAHYANKLNMTTEEINRHFPPTPNRQPSEERRLPTQKYPQQIKSNYLNFYPTINTPHYQPPPPQYHYHNPPQSLIQEVAPLPNDPRLNNGEIKRKRFASQQTRAVVAATENYETKPKKSQHRDEQSIDFKGMLSKLKELNRYQCKECGMSFSTGDSLEKHKDEHLREKLMMMDGGSSKQAGELCTEEKWAEDENGQIMCELFVIREQRWGQEALCACCCCELVRCWVDDQWVFVNASIVSIQGERSIMHKSCQRILESSLKMPS